ncbi:hypothetical protein K1719_021470 [Acacia pycnantha]|nr:hypothetical protein K1719_021470 [Acacia pycnantha]
MESNNSSSNTATACSSDPPPPNQRNDDKGKQTCSNESEANNNPDSSVLKPGKKGGTLQYIGVAWGGLRNSGDSWAAKLSTGAKQLYLGRFGTEEEAAKAFDIAAIRLKDLIPIEKELNFDLKNYNTEDILKCSKIPIGEGACKAIKKLTAEGFLGKYNIKITKSDDVVGVVPFGAENQRVANSEGFVHVDDNDDVAFPPPNQTNGDKGKPTCSRNESEENENKNNNPEGNKGGSSLYDGVTWGGSKNSRDGWAARLCKGKKQLYLGKFGTEDEAAKAFDIAAIRLKDLMPIEKELNFDLKNYNTEEILKCSKIPIGEGACKAIKKLTAEGFLGKYKIKIIKSDDVVGVVPSGAENQRVANSEGSVYMDDKDDVAFPPPNQRNGDKGKSTCSRNESEENENKNNNPESSVLKAGDQPKSSSCYNGFEYMDDNEYDDLLLDGFFENGFPWDNDDQWSYSELRMNEPLMEHLVSGNYSLNDFKDLDSTDDVEKAFADEDAAS